MSDEKRRKGTRDAVETAIDLVKENRSGTWEQLTQRTRNSKHCIDDEREEPAPVSCRHG